MAINYYDVLEVSRAAEREEIRRSFKRLAKKYHPDVNAERQKWADAKMRTLLKAYNALRDEGHRAAYDRHLRTAEGAVKRRPPDADEETYPESLRQRPNDPQAQARLVLHDLLNENDNEALTVYERLRGGNGGRFDLALYLDTRDYRDCQFLLGEAYERQGNWRQALRFYENVYKEEKESPSRFFLEEVKDRIRDIYCKKLARRSPPLEAINVYRSVLALGISKKTEAYIHKKMAESYYKAGKLQRAKEHLGHAFQLEPRLKGAQKICEKLGVKRTVYPGDGRRARAKHGGARR